MPGVMSGWDIPIYSTVYDYDYRSPLLTILSSVGHVIYEDLNRSKGPVKKRGAFHVLF